MTPHRFLAFMLVAALMLAQALGLMHRVVHAPGLHGAHAHQHVHEDDDEHLDTHAHGKEGAGVRALFAAHDDESTCRLLDAVSTDVAGVQCLLLSVLLPAAQLIRLTHGDFVARWAAMFDARGPPATR